MQISIWLDLYPNLIEGGKRPGETGVQYWTLTFAEYEVKIERTMIKLNCLFKFTRHFIPAVMIFNRTKPCVSIFILTCHHYLEIIKSVIDDHKNEDLIQCYVKRTGTNLLLICQQLFPFIARKYFLHGLHGFALQNDH